MSDDQEIGERGDSRSPAASPESRSNSPAHFQIAKATRASLSAAVVLLLWDAVLTGSFVLSSLVCPYWFLVSVIKNLIWNPGWKVTLVRLAIPLLTLGIVFANNAIQWRIGEANMRRIITACDEFHADSGRYPKTLDELVPRYLHSIPRERYCLFDTGFMYFNFPENNVGPMLVWVKIPPFGRKVYTFADNRWGYID